MALLSLQGVSLHFTTTLLLDGVDLQIEEGERIGLVGRNGAGKTSLLRLLEGTLTQDSGDITRQQGLRVAGLPQDVPQGVAGTVAQFLRAACIDDEHDRSWEVETRIDQEVAQLGLDPGATIATLSAGSKRRVLLAAALVPDSDLLLLDEPTNHLDLDAILHMEEALVRRRGALVFVTHDRAFLRRVATRILDLDRGALRSYRFGYDLYVERREEELKVEAEQAALFDKKLASEEAWLRRGIKARRTRNEGRVRALEALRRARSARRAETGRVVADLQEAERSGKIVIRARGLGSGLDLTVLRGDRIGVLGPNGCGKTTLLRMLLGERAPDDGSVAHGTKLEVAHFEQLHESLDPAATVLDNVAEGRETIEIGATRRHVVGYLQDFLFTPEQIQGPIVKLSGGERRRLQLAKVLSRPCNLLVLDEPTNDLDLETLELLEDLLADFQGTLLVVSHDREFLNNVVTSTLAYEGGGRWGEYVGGYDDWVRQRPAPETKTPPRKERPKPERAPARSRRLGFNETRELDALPGRIEALEAERDRLFTRMSSPAFYSSAGGEIAAAKERLTAIEVEIQTALERWVELESVRSGEDG